METSINKLSETVRNNVEIDLSYSDKIVNICLDTEKHLQMVCWEMLQMRFPRAAKECHGAQLFSEIYSTPMMENSMLPAPKNSSLNQQKTLFSNENEDVLDLDHQPIVEEQNTRYTWNIQDFTPITPKPATAHKILHPDGEWTQSELQTYQNTFNIIEGVNLGNPSDRRTLQERLKQNKTPFYASPPISQHSNALAAHSIAYNQFLRGKQLDKRQSGLKSWENHQISNHLTLCEVAEPKETLFDYAKDKLKTGIDSIFSGMTVRNPAINSHYPHGHSSKQEQHISSQEAFEHQNSHKYKIEHKMLPEVYYNILYPQIAAEMDLHRSENDSISYTKMNEQRYYKNNVCVCPIHPLVPLSLHAPTANAEQVYIRRQAQYAPHAHVSSVILCTCPGQ